MFTNFLARITAEKFLTLSCCLLAGGFLASAQADDKYASESGEYNTITWLESGTTTTTPSTGDFASIGNGYDVNLVGDGGAGQLRIGNTEGGFTGSGTFTMTASSGTFNAAGSGSIAIQVGSSASSNGALKVDGGLLQATAGWLSIGYGANSTGSVTISGGKVETDGSVTMGFADGANASLLVSGGELDAGDHINVGRRIVGTTTASFVQTSGTTTVIGTRAMRVGYAGGSTQVMNASAEISGGSFSGNVLVGRQSSLLSGGGTGTMIIGSAADIAGKTDAWEVSATGEMIFELGATDSFNAVDLTLATDAEAISFTQSGAKLTIDGDTLAFGTYGPITLIEYGSGKGPDGTSLANVNYDFINFDPGFATPTLIWTDTQLQLSLVPEPSVLGLIAIASVLGLTRRRRA